MKKRSLWMFFGLLVIASPALAGAPESAAAPPGLERFKALAGEWVSAEDGPMVKKGDLVARYRVTGAGSAVVEELFPGSPHEMLTVYTAQGPDLVLTHYCMSGNQPRMRAKGAAGASGSRIAFAFAFDGGANLDPAKDQHMHSGSFELVSADELRSEWIEHAGGKPAMTVKMHLVRKKDQAKGDSAMKYLLLIYENEKSWDQIPEAEQGKIFEEYMTYTRDIKKGGQYIGGEALQPIATATTVRVKNGKTLTTDGPFAETREQLGGYYLVEAKDLDEAIALAAKIPASRTGAIEVRPIMPTPPVD